VCSRECRKARDRKLSRSRRRRELHEHRAGDRERQKDWRARRAGGKCHAPPSEGKDLELQAEIVQNVDRLFRLSRASLLRRLLGIFQGPRGPIVAKAGVVSRATFAAQAVESTMESVPNVATRHA